MLFSCLTAAAAAALVAYLLTPLIRRLAEAGQAVDKPDRRRKLHRRLVSLWGGLAILPALICGCLAALGLTPEGQLAAAFRNGLYQHRLIWLLAAAGVLLAAGLVDDKNPLPPKVKLLLHLVAATLAVSAGFIPATFLHPFTHETVAIWPPLGFVLAVAWLIFIMNAFNFLDGLDGLACGQAAIAGAALSLGAGLLSKDDLLLATRMQLGLAGMVAAAVAGAGLGFWKHNHWPAKIFLGEAGSTLLGFGLGLAGLGMLGAATAPAAPVVPVVMLAWPIMDTLAAMVRRWRSGAPISKADHQHLHHRLLETGFQHSAAVAFIHGCMLLLAGLGLVLAWL